MNICVRMQLALEEPDPSFEEDPRSDGPLFHRWLPDGERDAVQLTPQVRVWFTRCGIGGEGRLIFPDPKASELSGAVLATQSPLHGGPLIVDVRLEVDASEHAAMVQQHVAYEEVARRVYKASFKPVRAFVDVLRIKYGQFWLRMPPPPENVGEFFNNSVRGAAWMADGDTDWQRFRPSSYGGSIHAVLTSADTRAKLLKEADWRDIQGDSSVAAFSPSIAAEALSRACQLVQKDDIRTAAVECVSALEIALDSFVECNKSNALFARAMDSLKQRPPLGGVLAIAAPHSRAAPADVVSAFSVIDARNKIVHEGWEPTGQEPRRVLRNEMWACCAVISALLPGPGMRILRLGTSYSHYRPDQPDPPLSD